MYDILIKNGTVIDFEKNERVVADVGIKDGKIIDVGRCTEGSKETIDAEGLIVSPGFIDIHMHEEKIGDTVDGDDYDIANYMLKMGVTTGVGGNCGTNSQDIKDFFEFIDHNGSPINYLTFIGHNFLRDKLNIGPYEKAFGYQINKMKEWVKEDIEENGAIGISFGIEYAPGITFDEILNLCSGVKDYNILLTAHSRKGGNHAVDAITELVEIAKETNKPMQISHIGSCAAYGHMRKCLDNIKEAKAYGADITADCYPYNAFSTHIGSTTFDKQNFEKLNKSYEDILLTEEPYKGIRCTEELLNKVRKEYPDMLVVAFMMNGDEVIEALRESFVYVASDGILNRGQGHPRAAGTFPRVLGKFVRQDKQLDFIETLKKVTLLPAQRLGLKNKGDIKPGMDGDITIFDPDTIIDNATFEEPVKPPTGIEYVIINGKIALKENNMVNTRLGRVIRREELDL